MLLIQDDKATPQSIDNHDRGPGDLPPAYDAISLHHSPHSPHHNANPHARSSTFPQSPGGPSSKPFDPAAYSNYAEVKYSDPQIDKSLPAPPKSPVDDSSLPQCKKNTVSPPKPQKRKNNPWLSLLPFVSSSCSKRVRQSVLDTVADLVNPSSHSVDGEHKNAGEVLAAAADTCSENKLSLSSLLQETFIADHTPMYWAVVNYRQELLVALLFHAKPLNIQTVSEIRRACVATSNQPLFQALRVRRPPFQRTDGIQVPSLRTASDNLLLGNRPADDIHIQQSRDGAFVARFEISLWQRRMRAIGQVNIEFIASERIWSVTFFSTNPPSQPCGKSKKGAGVWHVMITLLEASPSTFVDSQLVIDVPPPVVPQPTPVPRLREVRSTSFPASHERHHYSRASFDESNYDGKTRSRMSGGNGFPGAYQEDYSRPQASPSKQLPPPMQPVRGSPATLSPPTSSAQPPSISLRLTSGTRKLGRRIGKDEHSSATLPPTTKPETWSDKGVNYTNAVVSPLGDAGSQLLYDNSRYLLPDGTMRGRLEVRLVKTESSKDCIIC